MTSNINFSLIKKKREEKGISLEEMAQSLGFKNASTYLKYENNTYSFKLTMLPVLSKKLEIPYEKFFVNNISELEIKKKSGAC